VENELFKLPLTPSLRMLKKENFFRLIFITGFIFLSALSYELLLSRAPPTPNKQDGSHANTEDSHANAEENPAGKIQANGEEGIASPDNAEALAGIAILRLPDDDPRKHAFILKANIRGAILKTPEQYAALYKQLGLDDSEISDMNSLMVERNILGREAQEYTRATTINVKIPTTFDKNGQRIGGGTLSTNYGDLDEAMRHGMEATDQIDALVAQKIGPDKYPLYFQYVTTYNIRMAVVKNLQGQLKEAGVTTLDEKAQDQLIAIFAPGNSPYSPLNIPLLTDQEMDTAKAILSPEQYAILQRMREDFDLQRESASTAIAAKRAELANSPNGR
jgi:hypothetical protein